MRREQPEHPIERARVGPGGGGELVGRARYVVEMICDGEFRRDPHGPRRDGRGRHFEEADVGRQNRCAEGLRHGREQ